MVRSELLLQGELIRHYSDTPGMGLRQVETGKVYEEAIDLCPAAYTYEEVPLETAAEGGDLEKRVSVLEEEVFGMKGAM